MDPGPSPSVDKLGNDVADAKIIEMVIEYHWLQKEIGNLSWLGTNHDVKFSIVNPFVKKYISLGSIS